MNTRAPFEDWDDPKAKQFRKTHGKQVYPDCLGKYCWQHTLLPDGYSLCAEENCSHTFAEWLTGACGWEERLELHTTPLMGVGLYSKCAWKKNDILGAYLGEFIPYRPNNTAYCHEVIIGPAFEKTKAPVAYIDAEHCGNYVRFCNHSCEHNAVIGEDQVGDERVLVLRATRRISAGEQVTIDYGEDYFRGRGCKCGSLNCRYPNGMAQMRMSKRLDEDRSVRHDSVLNSGPEIDLDTEIGV